MKWYILNWLEVHQRHSVHDMFNLSLFRFQNEQMRREQQLAAHGSRKLLEQSSMVQANEDKRCYRQQKILDTKEVDEQRRKDILIKFTAKRMRSEEQQQMLEQDRKDIIENNVSKKTLIHMYNFCAEYLHRLVNNTFVSNFCRFPFIRIKCGSKQKCWALRNDLNVSFKCKLHSVIRYGKKAPDARRM